MGKDSLKSSKYIPCKNTYYLIRLQWKSFLKILFQSTLPHKESHDKRCFSHCTTNYPRKKNDCLNCSFPPLENTQLLSSEQNLKRDPQSKKSTIQQNQKHITKKNTPTKVDWKGLLKNKLEKKPSRILLNFFPTFKAQSTAVKMFICTACCRDDFAWRMHSMKCCSIW